MLIALPLYGAIAVPLIPLIYGDAFSGSVVPFVFLLGGSFAISQSLAYVAALTGAGKPKALALVSWIGAATTIALDLVLVPSAGATGAAIASLIAYAVFSLGIIIAWHKLVGRGVRYVEHVPRRSDVEAVSRVLLSRLRAAGHRA
jgi:O-antigen/teichoic acid export membrane protein